MRAGFFVHTVCFATGIPEDRLYRLEREECRPRSDEAQKLAHLLGESEQELFQKTHNGGGAQ